ncbi:uncharacterized protein LOC111716614 [Eurytemora carolleeae]|uniref:uncharacterized protein LOC111716614 n=1 Tax=Eurytemora carolleeae TaxID=1294199 RepID=UPI000C765BD0|nr:uncharacterized protein LOC111716614 [Eurytemora carolleeae]|eukprot:XP_023347853.1 uncharacterized protein LOC111716614 [Eurytemora affinis]
MPCFSRCCCCVNLRTGGLMMGVMTLALSVFSVIPMSISLVNRDYMAKVTVHMLNKHGRDAENKEDPFSYLDFWGTVSDVVQEGGEEELPADDDPQVERLRASMLVFFIVCIILLVVYLFVSLMLMYGSVKGSRWCLLPWLVSTLLFIIAYMVGMCLSTVLFGISVLSLAFLVVAVVESVIALYLWLCVVSLFQHLANRQTANQVR